MAGNQSEFTLGPRSATIAGFTDTWDPAIRQLTNVSKTGARKRMYPKGYWQSTTSRSHDSPVAVLGDVRPLSCENLSNRTLGTGSGIIKRPTLKPTRLKQKEPSLLGPKRVSISEITTTIGSEGVQRNETLPKLPPISVNGETTMGPRQVQIPTPNKKRQIANNYTKVLQPISNTTGTIYLSCNRTNLPPRISNAIYKENKELADDADSDNKEKEKEEAQEESSRDFANEDNCATIDSLTIDGSTSDIGFGRYHGVPEKPDQNLDETVANLDWKSVVKDVASKLEGITCTVFQTISSDFITHVVEDTVPILSADGDIIMGTVYREIYEQSTNKCPENNKVGASESPVDAREVLINTTDCTNNEDAIQTDEYEFLLERLSRNMSSDRIMAGSVHDLPPPEPTTVRIFLSSTFSDMKQERNYLARHAYPVLKQYCSSRGLDFQVVDMRWGVTNDTLDEHATSSLCLREIQNCHRLSLGPNFVALVGDRYGYRPILSIIPESEFNLIRNEVQSKEDLHLLEFWYKKDDNSVPPTYILQPIERDYLEEKHSPEDATKEDKRKGRSQDDWNLAQSGIRQILSVCVTSLAANGSFSSARAREYMKSVTEEEITEGILRKQDPSKYALCIIRRMEGIQDHLEDNLAAKYTDLTKQSTKRKMDSNAQELLSELRDNHIPNALGVGNILRYNVPWYENGIDISHQEHEEYLRNMCAGFINKLTEMINTASHKKKSELKDLLFDEVVHHAQFCVQKCSSFCGRSRELQSTTEYIHNKPLKPLVVHASSGIGKTSFLAMMAKFSRKWLHKNCVTIVRFLGTSPDTSDISSTLLSVYGQICYNYSLKKIDPSQVEQPHKLFRAFADLLQSVSENGARYKPLLVILDSIDQLNPSDGVYSMTWLPKHVPPDVHLIISTLPRDHRILDNAKQWLGDESAFVELPSLSETTAEDIITSQLAKHSRRLTVHQFQTIKDSALSCPTPLYLKLMIDDAISWKSYTEIDHDEIPSTARDAILSLLDKLERKYGEILTRFSLSYILASKGISELEMEDALSCNDELLDDVYRFHDPPVDGIVRVPPLLWARVRYDINEYLVERQVDGKTVMAWYHRLFKQAVGIKYMDMRGVMTMQIKEKHFQYNHHLAELFMAENGVKRTIFLTHRNKTIENADRQVTEQPLVPSNIRKLNLVSRLMSNSGKFDDIKDSLKDKIHCNFNWLLTKLQGTGIQSVLQDYKLMRFHDDEIEIMGDFFNLSLTTLRKDPFLLAQQIVSRLTNPAIQNKFAFIHQLTLDAVDWLNEKNEPLLVPVYPCLTEPGGELKGTIPGPTHVIHVAHGRYGVLWGKENGLEIWDMEINELVSHIYDVASPYDVTLDSMKTIAFHTEDTYVVGNDIKTGARIYHIDMLPEVSATDRKVDVRTEGSLIKVMAHSEDGDFMVVRVNKIDKNSKRNRQTLGGAALLLYGFDSNKLMTVNIEGNNSYTNITFYHTQSLFLVSSKSAEGKNSGLYICDNKGDVCSQIELPDNLYAWPESLVITESDTEATLLCCFDNIITVNIETKTVTFCPEVTQKPKVKVEDIRSMRDGTVVILGYDKSIKSTCILFKNLDGTDRLSATSKTGLPKCLSISNDEQFIFVGYSVVGVVEVWLLNESFKCIYTLKAHTRDVNRIVYIEHKDTLFTGSSEGCVKVWRVNQVFHNKPIKTISHKKQKSYHRKASGIKFDVAEDTSVPQLKGQEEVTEQQKMITNTDDHTKLKHNISNIMTLEGGLVVTSSEMQTPCIWSVQTGDLVCNLQARGVVGVPFLCKMDDGQTLMGLTILHGDEAKKQIPYSVKVWEPDRQELVWEDAPKAVALTAVQGMRAAVLQTLTTGSKILIIQVDKKEIIRSVQCTRRCTGNFLKLTPDLECGITMDTKKKNLCVWYLNELQEDEKCKTLTVPVSTSPQTVKLVGPRRCWKPYMHTKISCGTTNGNVLLFDPDEAPILNNVAKNKQFNLSCSHQREVLDLVVSQDGRVIVTASTDCTIIWRSIAKIDPEGDNKNPQSQKAIRQFEGHTDKVLCVTLSEDGRYLASGSRDQTVRIWSVISGKEICQFDMNVDVYGVQFTEDTDYLMLLVHRHGLRRLVMLRLLHLPDLTH